MNWMSKLLRKPPAQPTAVAVQTRLVTQSLVDRTARLRHELIAAANNEQREQVAGDLGRALAELLQAPLPEDTPVVWVAAACHVSDKVLAQAWTAKLVGDAWLGEVAIHGRFSEVRLAALQRIEDSEVLERVAEVIRDKDKRVYRCCTERLRQRRQASEDARRAVELAAALRDLLDFVPIQRSRMFNLEKEFSSLGDGSEAISESKALMDEARSRVQQESLAERNLQACLVSAQQLGKECSNVECATPEQLNQWHVRIEALAHALVSLPSWLSNQPPSKKLEELLYDIECRLVALDAESQAVIACEEFLTTHATCSTIDEESAIKVSAAWDALAKPENQLLRQAFESRWLALQKPVDLAPMRAEPAAPAAKTKIDHEAVRLQLEKLEHDLEQGCLADAEAAAKALDGAISGIQLRGKMESRLQQANAQLANLRGWALWGTQQVREELISAAEQLLIDASNVDHLEQGVKGLREKWKQLNVHGESTKSQWERFDAALEKAYQPVAARHAAENARLTDARKAKMALCDECESYFSSIVWESVDYKVLETFRQDMLRRWRASEQGSFRDERTLRKRLDKLLNIIDQRLEAIRATKCERFEQLIAEAEALRELSDIGRAITKVKALQGSWKEQQAIPVLLNRRDEQKLWQRFRAACDEVFAQRDAQRIQQAAQQKEQAQIIRGILDAFVVSLKVNDANLIKRDLNQFRANLKAAKGNSWDLDDGLEKRVRDLLLQAEQRIAVLLHKKHSSQLELLAKKAVIAEGVEAAAVAHTQTEAKIDEAMKAWDALPLLPVKSETMLAKRLAKASGVTSMDLVSGREAREMILIDLEIALDLPSPVTSTEARSKRQLEHLKNRFSTGLTRGPEAEALLVHWYATAAAPDAALDQRMAVVKHKLLEQIDRSDRPPQS